MHMESKSLLLVSYDDSCRTLKQTPLNRTRNKDLIHGGKETLKKSCKNFSV